LIDEVRTLFLTSLNALMTLAGAFAAWCKTSAELRLENLALRQQLGVLRRSAPKRLRLIPADRAFWVWIKRIWNDWDQALMIVKPETVLAWHRKGFRLFWTWRVRRGKPGRPSVAHEVRDLIRMMSRNNPRWGAPRIHGELLKLGIQITEPTVAKYMIKRRKPPSQTWRTFLNNHVQNMVSVDFFTVPTVRFQILYVFLVLAHDRRRIVHFGVTAHPTAEWTAQQMREAFPWDSAPRYLLRDRDKIFGKAFVDQVKAQGIKQVLSAPRSPWQRLMSNGSSARSAANVWIMSLCLESDRCIVCSAPTQIIIIAGAPIWRWAKTLQDHEGRNRKRKDE
jgi:putative transposase